MHTEYVIVKDMYQMIIKKYMEFLNVLERNRNKKKEFEGEIPWNVYIKLSVIIFGMSTI